MPLPCVRNCVSNHESIDWRTLYRDDRVDVGEVFLREGDSSLSCNGDHGSIAITVTAALITSMTTEMIASIRKATYVPIRTNGRRVTTSDAADKRCNILIWNS
jgi:hypothetical protein